MININGLRECPYCGNINFEIKEQHRVYGHGETGTETFLHCKNCNALTTFKNYYNQFDKEKYNKRYTDGKDNIKTDTTI